MNRLSLNTLAACVVMLLSLSGHAQQFEVVHALDFGSTSGARAALDALFEDKAMKGGQATLYALDVGDGDSSHLIVEDFDNYSDRVALDDNRRASHGWSKFLLATQDSDYKGSQLIMVVDDHGKARHTAGYLAAFLIHTTDPAGYRQAIKDLADAIGNPGVFRLVAMRTGDRQVTHAVLVGGKDFATVNKYIDDLNASDAYKTFVANVGDTRKVLGLHMYRRIGTWGYRN